MKRLNKIKRLAEGRDIPVSKVAGVDGLPEEREFDHTWVRGPGDVVISGPLSEFIKDKVPKGRIFSSRAAALAWAREKYGEDRVFELPYDEDYPRWALLIKNLRR